MHVELNPQQKPNSCYSDVWNSHIGNKIILFLTEQNVALQTDKDVLL